MKGIPAVKQGYSACVLLLTALLLSACGATTPPQSKSDQLANKIGYGHGSEVPGQLDDGGWVMNTPGQAHTHKVLLAECPDKPIITRHTHDQLHAGDTVNDLGSVAHKHNGCFICPAKNGLVKRILSQ